jgi:hypothetical protein
MVDKEDLKQRLKDMGTLSDSRTPKDALEYIEQLEYDNLRYALEAVASLSQAQEAYDAQAGLQEELQEAQQWINYWAKLWERSSTMLMQHHPAFTETTEIIFKDKKVFIKELFGEDLLIKINVVEEDTEDGLSK